MANKNKTSNTLFGSARLIDDFFIHPINYVTTLMQVNL
jgi:hypothetical protein